MISKIISLPNIFRLLMGGTPCACGLSSKKHKFMFIKNILRLQLAVQEQTKSDEKDKDRASPKIEIESLGSTGGFP